MITDSGQQPDFFLGVSKSKHLESKIFYEHLYVTDRKPFNLLPGLLTRLGILLLRFDSKEDLLVMVNRMDDI